MCIYGNLRYKYISMVIKVHVQGFFRKKFQGGKPMFQEIKGGGIGWN